MRNALAQAMRKALVLVAIVAHWVLDDICFFLPTMAVDAISKMIFTATANSYRFEEWLAFWNSEKPVEK